MTGFYILVDFTYYTITEFLISLPIQIITIITINVLLIDCFVCVAISMTIVYYFLLKITSINKMLNNLVISKHQNLLINSTQTIYYYITEHHNICKTFNKFNNCWKRLYLTFFLTIVPVSLTFLHQLLFENIIVTVRMIYVIALIGIYNVLFLINYLLGLYSLRLHKMCKKLPRLQWHINVWPFRMRFKLKLLMCFERLSSNRKLGVNIGSYAVMTFPTFSKVCIV